MLVLGPPAPAWSPRTKQPVNNEQNGNKCMCVTIYFNCKWAKFSNQKWQSAEETRPVYTDTKTDT